MPESKVNLISTEQNFQNGLATCGMINRQVLTLMDENHNHILRAISNGKGAYVCSALNLVEAFEDHKPSRIESHWADSLINQLQSRSHSFPNGWRRTVGDANSTWRRNILVSSTKGKRKEARELYNNIGHPGDNALCKALENGNTVPTRITCQVVKNAKILLGPCIPCIQAKMQATKEKPSDSPPAEKIVDNFHKDIIPFPTSVGGNNISYSQLIKSQTSLSEFQFLPSRQPNSLKPQTSLPVCITYVDTLFRISQIIHHPRSEDKSIRAKIGIFISHGCNLRYLK